MVIWVLDVRVYSLPRISSQTVLHEYWTWADADVILILFLKSSVSYLRQWKHTDVIVKMIFLEVSQIQMFSLWNSCTLKLNHMLGFCFLFSCQKVIDFY